MIIKKKHILVAFFSSLIISVVLMTTVAGYGIYVQWKKDIFAARYNHSIYELTAELFSSEIMLYNVKVEMGDKKLFSGIPIMEGSLKNNSAKTVTSVLIEVVFFEHNGNVLYKDWFYPLGRRNSRAPSVVFGSGSTQNVLLPGEGISFKHLLKGCPPGVSEYLDKKSKFAKSSDSGDIEMVYSVKGLSLI